MNELKEGDLVIVTPGESVNRVPSSTEGCLELLVGMVVRGPAWVWKKDDTISVSWPYWEWSMIMGRKDLIKVGDFYEKV